LHEALGSIYSTAKKKKLYADTAVKHLDRAGSMRRGLGLEDVVMQQCHRLLGQRASEWKLWY
jgi:hypothetical protein